MDNLELNYLIYLSKDSKIYRRLMKESNGIIPNKNSLIYKQYKDFWDDIYNDSKLIEK